jgi:endonuclease/exonuclease/phosphatase (EEP) superfamily protein YafD
MSRSKATTTWTKAGWDLGIALSGAAVVRAVRPERSTVDIAITAATPWLLVPSGALLAGALFTRRPSLVGLAAALVAYQAKCSWPWPRPPASAGESGDGPQVRVAFANVWRNNTDVEGILAELAAGEHDVVGLAEVTDHHLGAIEAVFSPSRYPWRKVEPDGPDGSKGLALLSRFPIERVEKWWTQGHPQLDATVLVPGALPFRLLVVHTWGPVGHQIRNWRAQLVDIGRRAEGERTIIIGDFNATLQHRSFTRLVGTRWSVVGTRAFGGWRATWPANRWWRPALFRIDHILAGPEISVRSGRAGRACGSDHRPVSAVLGLPPAPETP